MVEDQAALCRVGEVEITEDDLKRLALISGFKDRNLAEKCLGEEYDLRQVIATVVTRESSKANAKAVKVQEAGSIKQVKEEDSDLKKRMEKLQGVAAKMKMFLCLKSQLWQYSYIITDSPTDKTVIKFKSEMSKLDFLSLPMYSKSNCHFVKGSIKSIEALQAL